ncbi:MAG TPA: FecR domain-containing protein [Bryobacteraceae bacterium]|nr:FecR domain-containing protein [Bryobacteraceae bacterium]
MTKQSWLRIAGVVGLTGASLFVPGAQAARTAVPGTVNYVEGKVFIDGNPLSTQQNGQAALQADQSLTVENGKAEVLLSPGAFLRVGSNSEVRMVAPELANPKVEVVRGEAMVEVDQKPKQARLDILERGADASLLKEGLYKFDADEATVAVIDGKVQLDDNGSSKKFGKGKEVTLTGAELKPVKFDRKAEDELYRWSDVRSGYLAEANEAAARSVYVSGGWDGWGPGWFWNPYFSTWSWMPGDGFFWSPFGYPFYSPGYVIYAPTYGPRYYRGGAAIVPPRGRGLPGRAAGPAFRSPAFRAPGAGFRGPAMGMRGGGGFHSMGGGVHGMGGRR